MRLPRSWCHQFLPGDGFRQRSLQCSDDRQHQGMLLTFIQRTARHLLSPCTEDDVVSIDLGLRAREFLVQGGYPCQWYEYAMPHSVCLEEIQEIGDWLNERISERK